jgi:molecular chaperone Hsp33
MHDPVATPTRFADNVTRFMFERAAIRGALVSLDDTCREILGQHSYPPALRRVLAELLAAAALLASTLSFKGTLVVQLQAGGPVNLLVVECTADLGLRATAQWRDAAAALPDDAPLQVLAGDAAASRLAIMLDPKDGGPIYQGIVALEAASIATLIEHYLTTSEQIDSRLVLVTDATRVRGMLLQRMPSAGPGDDITWRQVASRLDMDDAALLGAGGVEALLAARFPDHDLRVVAPRAARFRCDCSAERVSNALRMLGRAEIESVLAEQGMIGVTCEFCSHRYSFVAADALALFAPRSGGADAPPDAARPSRQ